MMRGVPSPIGRCEVPCCRQQIERRQWVSSAFCCGRKETPSSPSCLFSSKLGSNYVLLRYEGGQGACRRMKLLTIISTNSGNNINRALGHRWCYCILRFRRFGNEYHGTVLYSLVSLSPCQMRDHRGFHRLEDHQ